MEIHEAARKHRVRDLDILHALDNALVSFDISDGEVPARTLYLGSDRAGNMLEVVVLEPDDGRALAIHAMAMRPKYRTRLP